MAEIVYKENILGGVTFHGATSLHGSKVRHAGLGQTLIGELQGDMNDRVERVKDAFEASDIQTKVSANIIGHIWAKGLVYSAINPITASIQWESIREWQPPFTRP